jgi:ketosteroid isomerase-like protein
MRKLMIVLVSIIWTAGLAVAADNSDVMKPIHQFIDGFNKGDAKSALAACADETSIIDEFPPYEWHGANACSTWADAYVADAKKNGVTDGMVTIGNPRHVDVTGDQAYVVVPTTYSFKQNGKPVKESGSTMTVTLHKGASGWQVTAWTWAKK